jgi:DNA polymerase III delta subunit
MKLILLHGNAIKASRIKMQELRNKFQTDNVMVFDSSEDLQKILTNLQSISIFEEERLIILENPSEDFANYNLSNATSGLILWFDRTLPEKSPLLKFVKNQKGEILFFPESREITIFPFLDSLGNRSKTAFLELDKLKKTGMDTQYIITMIFYLLRSLIVTPFKATEFVRNKNSNMRAKFKEWEIKDIYRFILEIDFKIKSGLIDLSNAELMIVDKFVYPPPD